MSLQTRCFAFADYLLDEGLRELRRGGMVLPVAGKAFDLLVFMAANPGRPLLKKELLDAVWPDSFVEEANLTQNIFVLRKALGASGARMIQTLPARGYRFAAEVTEIAPEPARPHVPPQPAPATAPLQFTQTFESTETRVVLQEETEEHIAWWRSPAAATLAAVVLVLLPVAGWLGWQRYEDRVGGPPVQVVLADLDGDTGDPQLNRTLNDILRFELAQSPVVTVLAASTVRAKMPEMMHKQDDPLTLDLARDLCERTASQTVLHGHVARLGNSYVVTEEATNCVDGATLGAAKQEVRREDDLPAAMDRIGGALRRDLGESRRTLARFNQPLASQHTASLEALKEFSQAVHLSQTGRFAEAVDLLKKAVELDPHFAAAYYNLAAYSSDLGDAASARTYLQRAYDLREYTNQPARFVIIANYESDLAGDLYESLRNYRTWIELYPRSAPAWDGLAHVYGQLGRFDEAVSAARRHLELLPGNASAYENLATLQIRARDPAGARATCELALKRGVDAGLIHRVLLSLGHLTGDAALVQAQADWSEEHPEAGSLLADRMTYALQEGRFALAQQLRRRMAAAFEMQGAQAGSISAQQSSAWAWFELGEPAIAHDNLHVAAIDAEDVYQLLALAVDGQSSLASTLLAKQLAGHPHSTLWKELYAPLVDARLALLSHNPAAAQSALAGATDASLDVLYLRGEAYRQSGRYGLAEQSYRTLLAHAELAPESFELPLARIMLARTLACDAKPGEAKQAIADFEAGWSPKDEAVRFRGVCAAAK